MAAGIETVGATPGSMRNGSGHASGRRASVWSAATCRRFWPRTHGAPQPDPERQRQQVGALQTLAHGKMVPLERATGSLIRALNLYGRGAALFSEASMGRDPLLPGD